jgi:subtilisin
VTLVVTWVALALAIAATPAGAAPESSQRPPQAANVIEGHYIVVYEDSVREVAAETNRRERRLGFRSRLRYRHAVGGFSARLSPDQVSELRADPKVDFVSPDRRVTALAEVPLAPGERAPTGVRRIRAATTTTARERSGVGVAVLDTGIQLSHPTLSRPRHGTASRADRQTTATDTAPTSPA